MKRLWCAVLASVILCFSGCAVQEPYFGTFSDEETGEQKTKETVETVTENATSGETAEEETTEEETTECLAPLPHLFTAERLVTDSDAYCVLNEAGEIVLGKNEYEAYAPASITKVMTALTAIDHVSLSEPVTITEEELSADIEVMSSGIYPSFKPGETVTVGDLLYALILPSTNAAGSILAVHIAGSTADFAALMNEKAKELGCRNSHFMNAHGLDAEGHYVCAYDMTLILRAALQNETLRAILSAKSYTVPATSYNNERTVTMGHAMVNGSYDCPGVFAGKSGSTLNAKHTLVTAAERDGQKLFVCTLHSDDYLAVQDTDNLIEYAYASLKGTYPLTKNLIHDPEIKAVSGNAADISYRIDNGAVSGRLVYWNMATGTSSAVFTDLPAVTEEMTVHIDFPAAGAYTVQFFATGEDGVERVLLRSVLVNGQINAEGITRYNGCDYLIDAEGFLRTGNVETPDGCYVTFADGSIGRGFVGGKFYAGSDGKIVTGWFTVDNAKYYAQADGRIVTGRIMIDGTEYEFAEDGGYLISE